MSSILNSHNVSQKIINKLSGAMWQLFVATTYDFVRYVANTRMINRPGVAGAVLQTASSFIN